MKAASAATLALLAGNQFFIAELHTIALLNGTVLRYTDADGDLFVPALGTPVHSGTAQAGASRSLTLAASASTVADVYAKKVVSITGGTGAGQQRNVVTSRQNGFRYSPDASNSAYFKNQCTAVGNLVTCTATADPYVGQAWNTGAPIGGRTFSFSVELWVDAGQPTAGYLLFLYDAAAAYPVNKSITLTTVRTRYYFTATINALAAGNSINGRVDQQSGFVVGNNYHAENFQIEEGLPSENIHTEANPAVGVAVDVPWTVVPDATSTYDLLECQYSCSGPKIVRDRTKSVVGIEVDTMNITLHTGMTDLIQGIPFPQFAVNGGFDGARVQVDRCFMPTYGDTSAGVVNVFTGGVSDVKPSRTGVVLTVSSDLQLLNIPMPRNVYAPACSHNLYDSACGAVKASFGAASACASGSTSSMLNCALAQAAGYFDTGTITFTGGQNAGATRTVKSYTPGVINLSLPLPFVPVVGDTFTAYAGCDKSQATCNSKFGRLASFRGCPFIPVPEASI